MSEDQELFFPQHATKQKHTPRDLILATRLRDAVRGLKPHIKPNLEKWADQIAILTRREDPAEVQAVLEWYCENIKRPKMYHGHTGETFKKKYEDIRQWWQGEQVAPEPEITDKKLLALVTYAEETLQWARQPDNARQAALAWCQFWKDLWTNGLKLRDRLRAEAGGATRAELMQGRTEWKDVPAGTQALIQKVGLADKIEPCLNALDNPYALTRWCLRLEHDRFNGWEEWSGKLPEPKIDILQRHNALSPARYGRAFAAWLPLLEETDES